LSELAVGVELDQLADLDIDPEHNWWSHGQRNSHNIKEHILGVLL
jgi:hypothetical protein